MLSSSFHLVDMEIKVFGVGSVGTFDLFLGWFSGTGKYGMQFFGRQLGDSKIKAVAEIMGAAE